MENSKGVNKNDPLQREIIDLYSVKNKSTGNTDLLSDNEWLVLKSHWKFLDNKLISNKKTYLKKNELHSSKLEDKYKIKVPKNKEVLFIKDFNKIII